MKKLIHVEAYNAIKTYMQSKRAYDECKSMVVDVEQHMYLSDTLMAEIRANESIESLGLTPYTPTNLVLCDLDFQGWITTQIIEIDGVQYSQYGDNKISDYDMADKQIITLDDYHALLNKYYMTKITKPERITEERFNDMLEVLPPCRWHHVEGVEFFHVSERVTGNIVNWFYRINGDYYEFQHNADIASSDLVEHVREGL